MLESEFGQWANLALDTAFVALVFLAVVPSPSYRRLQVAERAGIALAVVSAIPSLMGRLLLDQRVEFNLSVFLGAFAISVLVRKLRETRTEYSEVASSVAATNSEAGAA